MNWFKTEVFFSENKNKEHNLSLTSYALCFCKDNKSPLFGAANGKKVVAIPFGDPLREQPQEIGP